ncbi:MAG: MGMT family protein [Thiotrichales bacterium]|nr:MGMT family protein [Thiotrichales bacterium]MCY4286233.1 MGMT family protein [Thiotrichales bacterium]MCY4351091.1 MGMT family protein [Thiotrichales bacterium]
MNSAHRLTVYERSGCHLCDDMVSTLSEWKEELGFEIERVDVDTSPGLAARYGTKVPVLTYGSIEVCHYFLDLDALHRALGGETGPQPRPRWSGDPPNPAPEVGEAGEDSGSLRDAGRYARIYAIVARIPPGRVATYGQIAAIEGSSSARMIGYAMAALSGPSPAVPWQRVLNAEGTVSERSGGGGTSRQRRALEAEGVMFDARGRIDFDTTGWDGPDIDWIERHGFHPAPRPRSTGRRRQ